MNPPSDSIQEFCNSEGFFFLDPSVKEYAESVLVFWLDNAGPEIDDVSIKSAMESVAQLDVPLLVRKLVPQLLTAFFEYLVSSGRHPDARGWIHTVAGAEESYKTAFRDDGNVCGKTFSKGYPDVGRNDPCPCGSGKKFKHCHGRS